MEIILTNNFNALIDECDFKGISKYNWYAAKMGNTYYAIRKEKGKTIYMHRQILNVKDKNILVDHKDRNGLNNLRSNIRECVKTNNQQNSSSRIGSTSIYLGVSWHNHSRKWRARINVNKININLGSFNLETDAAEAYNNAAIMYFKEYASLNQII